MLFVCFRCMIVYVYTLYLNAHNSYSVKCPGYRVTSELLKCVCLQEDFVVAKREILVKAKYKAGVFLRPETCSTCKRAPRRAFPPY